ncbi:HlyD family secretion protein [Calothrix sp. PCC 7507]|uniref:HlyD family secretion protein n=1 Tax=Calothrix sp. PCC 7507 TaxID=99598 RepID=UPI00029EE7F3|nr:HlyD family secretion protein [Calothrix sp. PCC 7507]AFY32720.1 secretion protein HlyD family protein [Calothrix sp. PCC 7507]
MKKYKSPQLDEKPSVADDIQIDKPIFEPEIAPESPIAQKKASKFTFRNRRAWFLLGGAITLTLGTIMGGRWWQFHSTHVSTDNAQIQGHVSPIASKIPATVQQVEVKEGDYVKAGQPLIILEDQDLNLKVQQAEANLAAAKAQLQSATDTVPLTTRTNNTEVQQAQSNLVASESAVNAAKADITQAQALVDTNRAKVTQAQTEVNKTQADFRRYDALYREGAIAAQQRDTSEAALANAQANLAAVKQTVAQAQAQVSNAQAQLQKVLAQTQAARGQVAETKVSGEKIIVQKSQTKQAQAQVDQAAATLALARQQLQYTVIKAPISGNVGNLTAQVGQKVQTSQPLLSIIPLETDQIYVEANFKETELKNLYIGEPAAVAVDAYPGDVFQATVAGISPATGSSFALLPPDNATGNFNKVVQWVPVRLKFNPNADPQHKLRAGLSVNVTVSQEGNRQ